MHGIAAVFALVAGCAFRFEDPEAAANSCGGDEDCGDYEACSPVTRACELQPPSPAVGRARGPFRCRLDQHVWAGAAVAAAWDEILDDEEGHFVFGGDVVLAERCYAALFPELGALYVSAEGASTFRPDFGRLGFFIAVFWIPIDAVTPGEHEVAMDPAYASLAFCPTGYLGFFPDECWVTHRFAETGALRFTTADLDRGVVAGVADFALGPSFETPPGCVALNGVCDCNEGLSCQECVPCFEDDFCSFDEDPTFCPECVPVCYAGCTGGSPDGVCACGEALDTCGDCEPCVDDGTCGVKEETTCADCAGVCE